MKRAAERRVVQERARDRLEPPFLQARIISLWCGSTITRFSSIIRMFMLSHLPHIDVT